MPIAGKVFIVGGGPGDPGLITLKGIRSLERADVVLYDALCNRSLLHHAPTGCECVDVGKRVGCQMQQQADTNGLMVKLASEGKTVVRLKGGDPFVFGRGGEEALWLQEAGVPFEVVPGVSSLAAVPAYAGIPITHRGLSPEVTVVTGHSRAIRDDGSGSVDWDALARANTTIVILMGVAHRARIAERLIAGGRSADTPVAAIRWGTTARQKTVRTTLGDLGAAPVESPSVIVVGEVAGLDLSWFENRPLFGRSIAVTRAEEQSGGIADSLEDLGAQVVPLPCIRISEPEDWSPVDRAIRDLASFDWAVFTSANGVRSFFARLSAAGLDGRALHGVKVACIGPATTGVLADRGLKADLEPPRRDSEGLFEAFRSNGRLSGGRFLLPGPDSPRDVLPNALRSGGAEVVQVVCYRTLPVESQGGWDPTELDQEFLHLVTFTSPSTVRGFVQIVGREHIESVVEWLPAACIGQVTSRAAQDAGFGVVAEPSPDRSSADGLVEAVVEHYSRSR